MISAYQEGQILKCFIIFLTLLLGVQVQNLAQDPHRYDEEIAAFARADQMINRDDLVVFTGSSSVRFWKSLNSDFPEYNIINRGFGGSQMSDLLYFVEPLITQYMPKKVFIYEGDNDISAGKKKDVILTEAKELVSRIWEVSPESEIYFIAAKPSVARWEFQHEYEQFNYALSLWALITPHVTYIDVWTPMLDGKGMVRGDIFIGDKLHMNEKGYQIWADVIRPYLSDK